MDLARRTSARPAAGGSANPHNLHDARAWHARPGAGARGRPWHGGRSGVRVADAGALGALGALAGGGRADDRGAGDRAARATDWLDGPCGGGRERASRPGGTPDRFRGAPGRTTARAWIAVLDRRAGRAGDRPHARDRPGQRALRAAGRAPARARAGGRGAGGRAGGDLAGPLRCPRAAVRHALGRHRPRWPLSRPRAAGGLRRGDRR